MDADTEQEFREFVAARWGSLYRAALLLTGQREAAEDLVQAALVRTVNRWHRLDQPEAYLRKVMYFQQVSRWRLRSWGREHSTAELPDRPDLSDMTAQSDARISIVDALRLLGPLQRAVIVLRFYEDLPNGEIATTLGISNGAVRTNVHRGLAKLRRLCPELALSQGETL